MEPFVLFFGGCGTMLTSPASICCDITKSIHHSPYPRSATQTQHVAPPRSLLGQPVQTNDWWRCALVQSVLTRAALIRLPKSPTTERTPRETPHFKSETLFASSAILKSPSARIFNYCHSLSIRCSTRNTKRFAFVYNARDMPFYIYSPETSDTGDNRISHQLSFFWLLR